MWRTWHEQNRAIDQHQRAQGVGATHDGNHWHHRKRLGKVDPCLAKIIMNKRVKAIRPWECGIVSQQMVNMSVTLRFFTFACLCFLKFSPRA